MMKYGAGMAGLVPADDARDGRTRLLVGATRPPACAGGGAANCHAAARQPTTQEQDPGCQGGPYQQPIDLTVELLPLSVPAIRHVLWALGQAVSADVAT